MNAKGSVLIKTYDVKICICSNNTMNQCKVKINKFLSWKINIAFNAVPNYRKLRLTQMLKCMSIKTAKYFSVPNVSSTASITISTYVTNKSQFQFQNARLIAHICCSFCLHNETVLAHVMAAIRKKHWSSTAACVSSLNSSVLRAFPLRIIRNVTAWNSWWSGLVSAWFVIKCTRRIRNRDRGRKYRRTMIVFWDAWAAISVSVGNAKGLA